MEGVDFIVELLLRRRYIPSPEHPLEINTEHQVKINIQKDFWPIKIEKYLEIVNTATKQKIRYLEETISADGFIETGGVFYPTRMEESKFNRDTKLAEGSLTPLMSDSSELVSTRSIVMEKVQANTGLSDDLFEFEFPNGTGYYDENMGMGMIVGESVELMAKHMAESADALPVSKYTKEEAIAILEKRREGKWEEADALREKILQQKGNQSSVTYKVNAANNTVTNAKAEHKIESTIQVPVQVKEVKSNGWIRPIIYIGLLIGCAYAGYFIIKTFKNRLTANE